MTELSFTPDGFQFAWDSTSIKSFASCPRKYYLTHIQGWKGKQGSVHLWFGGHYAKALETYHKLRAHGDSPEDALRTVVLKAMIDTWAYDLNETGERIPGTGAPEDFGHASKNRENLIRSIVWYFAHFANDTMELHHLSDGTPAVELSFSLPFGTVDGVELLYCGHMDKVVNYSGIYVQDQKTTTSAVTQAYFDGYTPDVQMSGYAWAGAQLFMTPISGVVIDVARIAVGFTEFYRGFVPRSTAAIEEFHGNTLAIIEEAARAHESKRYRMNPTACADYGGCAFRKVCGRHPDHQQSVLQTDFVQRPRWDPLKQR